jgi:class 3 adenylate cyclase/pimeloyl-ACP methyl ester carboxylesterase
MEMAAVNVPDVKYARSGDLAIAYQAVGGGSRHLVFLPMFSNLALQWLDPHWAQFFERLQSFSRLIMFDKRGTGLSDRPREFGTLETRMDDIRAVLDALGVERAALVGSYEGGQTCALFAATYPERTEALVLFNTPARAVQCADYGYGATPDEWRTQLEAIRKRWGERDFLEEHARRHNPSLVGNADYLDWYVTWARACASPGTALSFFRMFGETDIREVLPTVRVPTLVLYRAFAQAEMLDVADRIPGAQAIRVPGDDYGIFVGVELTTEVERFLTGSRREIIPDRVLTTVLFTDIVASTDHTAALGDSGWRDLLTRHHAAVRRQLARFGGQEVDTAGDGFFATFDGPARAIRCAQAIADEVGELGLDIRAGIHTGECEVAVGKVAGLAVIIGARVADMADAGEVLVSSTVTDLVAGSGIEFKDRGVHKLKGVPGERRVFAVL